MFSHFYFAIKNFKKTSFMITETPLGRWKLNQNEQITSYLGNIDSDFRHLYCKKEIKRLETKKKTMNKTKNSLLTYVFGDM